MSRGVWSFLCIWVLGYSLWAADSAWDVTQARGQTREIDFTTSEGTWMSVDISPDGKYLAVTEHNGKVRLTRMADGAVIARFDAPGEDYVHAPIFSADGRYLVAMSVDRDKQHVWDLWRLRRQLAELKLDWETEPAPKDLAVSDPIVVELAPQQPKP